MIWGEGGAYTYTALHVQHDGYTGQTSDETRTLHLSSQTA